MKKCQVEMMKRRCRGNAGGTGEMMKVTVHSENLNFAMPCIFAMIAKFCYHSKIFAMIVKFTA